MASKQGVGLQRPRLSVAFLFWMLIAKFCAYPLNGDGEEPRCYSRFDYEYKVIQKLFLLDQSQKELRETLEANYDKLEEELETVSRNNEEQLEKLRENDKTQEERLRQTGNANGQAVAFSTFLDETKTFSAESITFNQVLLNEPAGVYNPQSGIFTCPVSGVYVFSFVIATRGKGGVSEVMASLKVNNNVVAQAVSDSKADKDDMQGSNMAVTELTVGDTVFVSGEGTIPGNSWGRTSTKTSSFAGFLLYPKAAE